MRQGEGMVNGNNFIASIEPGNLGTIKLFFAVSILYDFNQFDTLCSMSSEFYSPPFRLFDTWKCSVRVKSSIDYFMTEFLRFVLNVAHNSNNFTFDFSDIALCLGDVLIFLFPAGRVT